MRLKTSQLIRRIAFAIFIILSYQASAYYDPHVGRFISRDPIGDVGFFKHYVQSASRKDRSEAFKHSLDAPYRFVNNDPIAKIDKLGLETVQAFVLTEIREPDAQAGVKTMHSVVVDDKANIIRVTTFVGATDIGDFPISGSGSFFQSAFKFPMGHDVFLSMGVNASSAALPDYFDIDYHLTIDFNFCTRRGTLRGSHDLYPSYVVRAAGQTLVDWDQVGSVLGLVGPGRVPMSVGFKF